MALETGDFLTSLGATGLGDFQTPGLSPDITPPTSGAWGMTADAGNTIGGGVFDVPLSFGSGGGLDAGAAAGVGDNISQGAGAALAGPSGGGIGSDWAASGGSGGTDALLGGQTDPNNPTNIKPPADLTGGGVGTVPQKTDSGMSPFAKTALMAAPALGVAGFQALRGPQIPGQVDTLTGLGNAQAANSAQLMQQYNSGNIQPGAALQIQNNLRNQISKINQYFAGNNRFNSTDRLKAVQAAQTAATAQYQQFLDSELKGALAASGQAGQFMAQAAQLTLSADAAFNAALASAMTGIGKIAGVGLTGGQTTTTTTTTQAA